jgi:hypothetical protein
VFLSRVGINIPNFVTYIIYRYDILSSLHYEDIYGEMLKITVVNTECRTAKYRGDGVRVPVGSGILSSPQRPDRYWGAYPTSCPVGNGGSFPGGKATGA